jgi:hypothetical protein
MRQAWNIACAAVLASAILWAAPSLSRGQTSVGYPRIANYYLPDDIADREVEILSRWNLLVLANGVDDDPDVRERLALILEANPDIIMLVYFSALESNVTENPPDPMTVACDEYDWWLRDYMANLLYNPDFPWSILVNMTNMEAAAGSHPEGKKPNRFLPELIVENHLLPYGYWSGVFYDVFSDNLIWMYEDVKDANRNMIPEYDIEEHEGEPDFSTIWADGALTLLTNTLELEPDAILIGNGQHKGALDYLNGRLFENFVLSSTKNMDLLSANHQFLKNGSRIPRISIVNGWIKDQDPTDYQSMRFTFCATLMTDNFYSCDFGSRYHGETIWFDEYSIAPDGTVDARTTELREDIDAEQEFLPVESTQAFEDSGVVEIEGEQIYYASKTDTTLLGCFRGFPRRNKYDLREPHAGGSTVIQHYAAHPGYLGDPYGGAFDASNPSVLLDDLLDEIGWYPEEGEAENINSRVWRRDFRHGSALVNPTDQSKLVRGLGQKVYRKVAGVQDQEHNDGGAVYDTLRVQPGDGYVLVWISETDTIPPVPGEGIHTRP